MDTDYVYVKIQRNKPGKYTDIQYVVVATVAILSGCTGWIIGVELGLLGPSSLLRGVAIPGVGRPERYLGLLAFFTSCQHYYFLFSQFCVFLLPVFNCLTPFLLFLLCSSFPCLIVLLHSCCSPAQVLGTPLVHGLPFSMSIVGLPFSMSIVGLPFSMSIVALLNGTYFFRLPGITVFFGRGRYSNIFFLQHRYQ